MKFSTLGRTVSLLAAGLILPLASGCSPEQEQAVAAAKPKAVQAVSVSDLQVSYKNGAYQLNWQTSEPQTPVKISVIAGNGEPRLLSESIDTTELSWPATATQRHQFVVESAQSRSSAATRLLPLDGGRNFRDLGGYETESGQRVKWGKLFRSGVLANLTEEDYQYLTSVGINTVVDFRSTTEQHDEPTSWQAGDINQLQWDYELDMDIEAIAGILMSPGATPESVKQIFQVGYLSLLEQQKPAYTEMFDRLANDDGPLLFHCSAGKDRTGMAAALLLTALGVERDIVMADYMASQKYLNFEEMMQPPENLTPERQRQLEFFQQVPEELIRPLMGVDETFLQSAIDQMEQQSGSVLAYIQQELQVSDEELQKLRELYLEG